MKLLKQLLLAVFLIVVSFFILLFSCKVDNSPTKEELEMVKEREEKGEVSYHGPCFPPYIDLDKLDSLQNAGNKLLNQ